MSESKELDYIEGGQIVRYGGLQHKAIQQLKEERKFKETLIKQVLKRGTYESGADYGDAGGVKGMVFKEAIELLQDAFYLSSGDAKIEKELQPTRVKVDNEYITVDHFAFTVKVPIIDMQTGQIVGVGHGRCSSREPKWRYKSKEGYQCPDCGRRDTIKVNKGKGKHKWYCYSKIGGCGANFMEDDERITSQTTQAVEDLDPDGKGDTILDMAIKRAEAHIILKLTGTRKYLRKEASESGIFDNAADTENQKNQEQSKREFTPPPEPTEQKQKSNKNADLFGNQKPKEGGNLYDAVMALYEDIALEKMQGADKWMKDHGFPPIAMVTTQKQYLELLEKWQERGE